MSDHFWFVFAAYAAAVIVLGGLAVWLFADSAARRRELAELEASGLRRRSDAAAKDAA